MDDQQALVIFTPSGRRGHFPLGTPLLDAARSLGVDVDSVCGGRGLCGRCQVLVSEGEFSKYGVTSSAESLCAVTEPERRYAERRELKAGRRLSCHARVEGDVVIDVPAESQVHRPVVRKDAGEFDFEIDPVIRLHLVDVQEPDMHEPASDVRRLKRALSEQWGLDGLQCELKVLQGLQVALRKGKWQVTVAVRNGRDIVAVWPGLRERAYGLAVDVGSTTVAAHLCDLATGEVLGAAGVMNPQIRFGEDLMSRVSYLTMNPGGEGELTDAVRSAINDLVSGVCEDAGLDREELLEMVVVGNPIMHHLLLGISPVELGVAPFALAEDGAVEVPAEELEIYLHPNARVYALPCIAGHVGADTAGAVLADGPHRGDEVTLLVDVGTNAEIVLGNSQRLLAASSPTGPAFEGAQISCGQRAASGAIERVRIDAETLEPRFKVVGCDRWSDESGFDRKVRRTGITGVCGSGIVEALAELYLAGVITNDGVIDGSLAARTARVVPDGRTFSYVLHEGENTLKITQSDVRAIQLAKAALQAGARLLMERLGVDSVDRIRLAGAFGSHIDVKYAMVLGLLPDCPLTQVASAGNAAGTGARLALVNGAMRREIEGLVRRIEKVETAVEPSFQAHFIEAMAIPHKSDPYRHLAAEVTLPAPKEASADAEAGGARRRRRRRSRTATG
ncbi:MAG: ASKHA domain-containing protein [Ectothiorhodospiraceae bacterium]